MFKTLVLALSAAGALAGAASAADITGQWLTAIRGGVVEISACGASVCGQVVDSPDLKTHPDALDTKNPDRTLRSRPIKGMVVLQGFHGSGGAWNGGRLYDPDSGNTYRGSLKLTNSDTLKVTGCIVWPACETQTWTRVK